jgi:protein TonB
METTSPKYSFLQPAVSVNDSLLMTLFIAAVIHIAIVLGISFSMPKPQKISKQIEITLANLPSKKAPKDAKHFAQDNQVGGGVKEKKPEPLKQKLASQGRSEKKPPQKSQAPVENKPKATKKLVTQKQANEKIETIITEAPPSLEKVRPKLSVDSLKQQIAQLGAQIRYSEQSSEHTKIKFVNSVSTHKYLAAQYMQDWEAKVERTGNLNYPEAARQKNFSGSLSMDVGIQSDGGIYSIRITKSSGNQALDDAAKRIVRLSAPFAELPAELLEELDVLVITRVWNFTDKTGITTGL